ncbi:MAG: hypothetical protein IV099_12305 [Phenylobacterium sp.]|nr:hypothetical protein ASE02_11580 [Phenylobacterium sp. Root700]MBT9471968.1 hypothetical protein [Phenylobacterium sp.]
MRPTRRTLLAAPFASSVMTTNAAAAPPPGEHQAAADALGYFVGQGSKASGGPGDIAVGQWMEAGLRAAGFRTERQVFEAPYFDVAEATLVTGSMTTWVIPQAIVTPTASEGVAGPLRLRSVLNAAEPADGAIVVLQLPYARWSSAASEAVRNPVNAAIAAGAQAVVLVTTGPTGEALALNADGDKPMFAKPVAIVGSREGGALLRAATAGTEARLTLTGAGGRREAFNVIGRLDRGHRRWLVVSTPRSGWFTCAGERGPGVAVWTLLARWAAKAELPVNVVFVCNSGHEYENFGAARLLDGAAPAPSDTAFWLHLGANVAARDWHEAGSQLSPLPSADPQRFLLTTQGLLPAARQAFSGLPGLETPYPLSDGAAGELTHIAAAGYPRLAGIFGAHRFHHARADDARCVSADLILPAAQACRALILAAI